jgi:alkylation response protein AidB-like acyl-CoA dehydrogenase
MKFDYSEEQRLVADSVRRFIAQDYGFEARKRIVASREGWSREVWAKIADIGLLGLPFPT